MGRVFWSLLACTLLFGALAAVGPEPALAYEPFCWVSGRLVDETTGEPALGTKVMAYGWHAPSGSWGRILTVETDGMGRFEIPVHRLDVRPFIFLSFHHDSAYYDEYYRDVPVTSAGPQLWENELDSGILPNTGDLVNVTRIGINSPAVDLGEIQLTPKLNPYGSISGRITDAYSGQGISNCTVIAYREQPSGGFSPFGDRRFMPGPQQNGTFTIAGTETDPLVGRVKIEVTVHTRFDQFTMWYPNAPTNNEARVLEVLPNKPIGGVNQPMTINGRMRGHVLNAETKIPVADAVVVASSYRMDTNQWDIFFGTTTDSNGLWVLPKNYNARGIGTYRIEARDNALRYPTTWYGQATSVETARDVPLPIGGFVDGLDILFSKTEAISGRVYAADGIPVPDIRVEALRETATGVFSPVASDYTDCAGLYSAIVGVADTYTLRFTDQVGTSDPSDDTVFYLGGVSRLANAQTLRVPAGMATLAPKTVYTPPGFEGVSRVWGDNRYETAIAASKTSFADGTASTVILASGEKFPDALSASGLAGQLEAPVLLTRPYDFYSGLLDEFDRLGTTTVYLLGGYRAINLAQESLLRALGYEVVRIVGADRYETSARVAEAVTTLAGDSAADLPVFIVRGDAFADALSVSPAAAGTGGIVLLVNPQEASATVSPTVAALELTHVYVVGGEAGLPDNALSGLESDGVTTERIAAGENRFDTAAMFADVAEAEGWLDAAYIGVATGTGFADALGAGSGLGREGGILLLTRAAELPVETAEALVARSATDAPLRIYGGTAAVRSAVMMAAGSQ